MTSHIISAMHRARGAPLPLEKAALCVTLDVIGRCGFQKDFGATASFEAAIEGKAPFHSGNRPLVLTHWPKQCSPPSLALSEVYLCQWHVCSAAAGRDTGEALHISVTGCRVLVYGLSAPAEQSRSTWAERAWGRVSEELGVLLSKPSDLARHLSSRCVCHSEYSGSLFHVMLCKVSGQCTQRIGTSATLHPEQGSAGCMSLRDASEGVCAQLKLTQSGVAHSDFRARMRALLDEVKARGEPKASDQSIAGLLLKLRDPKTGGCAHNKLLPPWIRLSRLIA